MFRGTYAQMRLILMRHRLRSVILIFFSLAFISGCLPSEDTLDEDSVGGGAGESFGGFVGLDSVETEASTKVRLRWTPTDDARVVGYNIYDVTLLSQPRLVRTVNSLSSEATIAGLSQGFYYSFRVRAVDEKGKEDANTKDLIGIPYGGVLGVQVISSSSARLTFSDASEGEARETNIRCKTSADGEFELFANVRDINRTETILEDLVPNTTYTCKATIVVDGHEDNNAETVVFQALGRADRIEFSAQPGNGPAGQPLSVQPIVRVMDENDNVVAGGPDATAQITLEVSEASPTVGTVRGTITIEAIAGVATFNDINLQESGLKILRALKADTSSLEFGSEAMQASSQTFNITPGAVDAGQSLITISPAVPPNQPLVANGSNAYSVGFQLKDAFGNPVSGVRPVFTSNIVGDILSQAVVNTDVNGETTASIASSIADLDPLRQIWITSPAGLTEVRAFAPFRHGSATRLAFTVQPVNSPSGDFGLNEMKVTIQDAQGNRVNTGPESSSTITLNISNNVGAATLSGTSSQPAINGVATFGDLGIDNTGTGYRLVASSGSLSPAFSNTFNVTAGVPRAISLTGPTDVKSGVCSTAITLQLRDLGDNPSNAIQNTTIQLGGLGNSQLFSSSTCGGSPLGGSITITPGTNTRTVYLRNQKAQLVNMTATDSSNVLTPGSLALRVNPSQIRLVAEAAAPAPGGTPLTVSAGQCSTAIRLTPLAADGTQGPQLTNLDVSITGLTGSQATLYSDAGCTTALDPSAIPLALNPLPNPSTLIYLRSPRGENLTINVADGSGYLLTVSTPQSVRILPSKLVLEGPATVVAGQCSTAFSLRLQDTLNNDTALPEERIVNIIGVEGFSATGQFYTSPACSGAGFTETFTIPSETSLVQFFFRGIQSEILNISVADSEAVIAETAVHQLIVTPSALDLAALAPGHSLSSHCVGPFLLTTRDGVGDPALAVLPITVDLAGAGDSGQFFSDSGCATPITEIDFAPGDGSKNLYFRGDFPEATLTLAATDRAGVLVPGTRAWEVRAAPSWLGTASEGEDADGNLLPFETGFRPVAARYDGIYSVNRLRFDPTKRYLYVVDYDRHRILKYDYENQQYIGWIGRLLREAGIGSSGSRLPTPSSASCVSTVNGAGLPGWCLGGRPINNGVSGGGFASPYDLFDDGTYIYVTHHTARQVSRHNATTGAFAGWIGTANGTPSGPAAGGPGSCSSITSYGQTPGWCLGGSNHWIGGDTNGYGTGITDAPRAITGDSTYLYIGVSGAVLRYNKTSGAFAGWIGRSFAAEKPTGGASGCTSMGDWSQTPGWCIGGRYNTADPRSNGFVHYAEGLFISGNNLYVVNNGYGGVINRYNLNTGAFIERLPSLDLQWRGPGQVDSDGTYFYFADNDRIIRTSLDGLVEGWMGKVANGSGMSGAGCGGLSTNQNTPGWCLGGTHKAGLDEGSYMRISAITLDGSGNLLIGGRDYPAITKVNATTGAVIGSMGLRSVSPETWSVDADRPAEFHGMDDLSMYTPRGSTVVGDYLFVSEYDSGRVKKLERKTGRMLGWIGGMLTRPTGGVDDLLCTLANAMSFTPTWCRGATFYPELAWSYNLIGGNVDGLMRGPWGLTSDGTWLYVTDYRLHRVLRFRVDDGSYGGWIGRINGSPTGGSAGCNGAASGTFTPGWCTGGTSNWGTGDGHLWHPSDLLAANGNLYVIDSRNHRVSSYNATTGAFNGWIGRIGTAPSGGCTVSFNGAYDVSGSGWCLGGTSTAASAQADRGGGFYFWDGNYGSITTEGANLYITNNFNGRIDKFSFAGAFLEATRTREDVYTNSWQSDPDVVQGLGTWCSYAHSIWTDGTHLYGTSAQPCSRDGDSMAVFKMNLSTGQVVGWKGAVSFTFPPTGGEAGCVGAVNSTPGWCQGGRVSLGMKLGQFTSIRGALTGDNNFIYVSDESGNRVTRLPK